ncbi:serine hydrolase [Planosporangium sp. 12N6]|uniref:serine hydrolase n=1 Tax=Planosporangium spinosum TaxID=3402278 RepID=UPI003CE916FA
MNDSTARSAAVPRDVRSPYPLVDAPPAVVKPRRRSPYRLAFDLVMLVALLAVNVTGIVMAGRVITSAPVPVSHRRPADATGPREKIVPTVRPVDNQAPGAASSGRTAVPPAGGAAPSGSATPDPKPLLVSRPVNLDVDGFLSWALLDRRTGTVTGSANHTSATSSTESMIKVWISADYLRLQAAKGATPSKQRLDELTDMIVDSDNEAASDIYQLDGGNAVVNRMIAICGLTGTTVVSGWWSKTQVTARDATRLGLCVADGRAAGPVWTSWILDRMRQVRGEGRFGIVDALPADVAATTAIKNGWTPIYDEGNWHIACLAVRDDWILAVLTRYEESRGLSYGADVCAEVTRQLMAGTRP